MKSKYQKDKGQYNIHINYSLFLKIDNNILNLINSCSYIFKDKGGEYYYRATSFDDKCNVYFTKTYLKASF